ncbi:hypothetical protein [Pseudomonas fluorescens]|nr:hypothetical protein [Pseudomonas fluorescens]
MPPTNPFKPSKVDGKLLFITTENHAVRLDGSDPQPLKVRVDAAR